MYRGIDVDEIWNITDNNFLSKYICSTIMHYEYITKKKVYYSISKYSDYSILKFYTLNVNKGIEEKLYMVQLEY